MSWLDVFVAISGALLLVSLGSLLIWEIFRTAQIVLTIDGLVNLETSCRESIAMTGTANQDRAVRPPVQLEHHGTLAMKQELNG